MKPGEALKRLRVDRNITVRDVECASQRIATAKSNRRFQISNGWLVQLENGTSEPSASKLFSLSVIYNVQLVTMLRLYDIDVNETDNIRVVAQPDTNHLIGDGHHHLRGDSQLVSAAASESAASKPNHENGSESAQLLLRGYIGIRDLTMYPLIRPGAFVLIDSKQKKVEPKVWRNEYERPIYFVELRSGYACGWCELDRRNLIIIPHPLSPVPVRQFSVPTEAEIVGRVTRFVTDCVDSSATEPVN
jgi:transcriptional regulator with XRE-family HTH domain